MSKRPKTLSSDGWDWAGEMSKRIHVQDEVRRLREGIRELKSVCGSCELWTLESCPRETRDISGRKSGPHMNSPICQKFSMNNSTKAILADRESKLIQLESGGSHD